MNTEAIELIRNSCGTGAILSIVYTGGSRHGLARDLVVTKIVEDGFFAYEGESIPKKYLFSRVASVADGTGENMGYHPPEPKEIDFQESVNRLATELERMGWVIHNSPDEELFFGVGRLGKKGKPLKNPVLSIRFSGEIVSSDYDLKTGGFVSHTKETNTPWLVSGEGHGKRFKNLEKALLFFEKIVSESKP